MRKFASFIVNHKGLIIILYMIVVVLSLIGTRYVSIEYDLSSYLPGEMDSIKGRDILEKEFGINGTASLMIKNKEIYQILDIKNKIQKLPEVKKVIWLDDVEDVRKPENFFDEELSKKFIRGDYSLLQIQFKDGNDSLSTRNSLEKIEKIVDGEYYIGGQAAVSKDMRDTTSREIVYYSIIAFIIISIILFLSSSSYFEPILFFIAIGAAIAINMGSNLIFDRVSSTTYSVASILQLAVSMDYSIFLLHRFHEESQNKVRDEAMVCAIEKTFSSIWASALTTVCGFLALITMKYGIGKDMGLVLAKGVFFSLVSVVTLLPCLVLFTEKCLGKYKHRVLMPDFKGISKYLVKSRHAAAIIAILIAVPCFLAQSKVDYYYSNEKTLSKKANSIAANEKINEVFGKSNEIILILPKSDKIKIKKLTEKIMDIENVKETQGLYSMVDYTIPESLIPDEIKETFESSKYTYLILNIKTDFEGEDAKKVINEIQKSTSMYFNEYYLTGESMVYQNLQSVTSKDFKNVTIISILLIGLILAATFKSIILPFILIFVIQLGIWINLSIPYFQGKSLNFISFIIIGAIQLGATVDYAILFTSRFKENLAELSPLNAMEKTIWDTGRSVLTSALILMAGTFSVSFITTIRSAAELTLLIGRGALISLILVYLVLPALLLLFNGLIKHTTIGWPDTIKNQ